MSVPVSGKEERVLWLFFLTWIGGGIFMICMYILLWCTYLIGLIFLVDILDAVDQLYRVDQRWFWILWCGVRLILGIVGIIMTMTSIRVLQNRGLFPPNPPGFVLPRSANRTIADFQLIGWGILAMCMSVGVAGILILSTESIIWSITHNLPPFLVVYIA
ncbi:hypothetical protein HGA91_00590 [candidate division WWE3 bacterium]|nr:hypothetical protein [candidate division WWE3 bacterium]